MAAPQPRGLAHRSRIAAQSHRRGTRRRPARRAQAGDVDHAALFQSDRPRRPGLPDPPPGDPAHRGRLERARGTGGSLRRGFPHAGARARSTAIRTACCFSSPTAAPRIAATAPARASFPAWASNISKPSGKRHSAISKNTPQVRDVLLSGGDPLLFSDDRLDKILTRLRAIPHIQFIRIGSRIPIFLPQRITPELCAMLKKHHPLFISIHTNHPRELTTEVRDALGRLADAGIPLGNQSVLLRGVNDSRGSPESPRPQAADVPRAAVLSLSVRPHQRLVPPPHLRRGRRRRSSKACAATPPATPSRSSSSTAPAAAEKSRSTRTTSSTPPPAASPCGISKAKSSSIPIPPRCPVGAGNTPAAGVFRTSERLTTGPIPLALAVRCFSIRRFPKPRR